MTNEMKETESVNDDRPEVRTQVGCEINRSDALILRTNKLISELFDKLSMIIVERAEIDNCEKVVGPEDLCGLAITLQNQNERLDMCVVKMERLIHSIEL